MKKEPLTTAPTPAVPTPELATKAHEGTPEYGDYGHAPAPAPAAEPTLDPRIAGGNVYDLSNEQTTL